MNERVDRVLKALEGVPVYPPPAGLSFVPTEVMGASQGAVAGDPADVLVTTVEDLALDFAFVSADTAWAARAAEGLSRSGRAVLWAVDGPLWPALRMLGIEEGLKATAWDPDRLESILDSETDRARTDIAAGVAAGAHAVVIADDIAGSAGPLISPDYLNEHLIHRLALLVAFAASDGLRTAFHSDGEIRAFLQSIVRAGFVAVHGGGGLPLIGFEALLAENRRLGLALLGGLDTVVLREGVPASVRLGAHVGVLASAGGLLISDDGGITTGSEMGALATAFTAASTAD
jgi:hypothetical protein